MQREIWHFLTFQKPITMKSKYTWQHEQFSKLHAFSKGRKKNLNGTFVEIHKHFLKHEHFIKIRFFKLWTIFGNGKMFWTYRRNLEICLLVQILFSIFEHITKTIILICNIFKSWIIFWKTQKNSKNGNNILYSEKIVMTKNYNFKHI